VSDSTGSGPADIKEVFSQLRSTSFSARETGTGNSNFAAGVSGVGIPNSRSLSTAPPSSALQKKVPVHNNSITNVSTSSRFPSLRYGSGPAQNK
jgi:hypothetical protein